MADTLFLKDGGRETILGGPREALGALIADALGPDARRLYDALREEASADRQALEADRDDWQKAAEGLQGFRRRALEYAEEALALLDVPGPDLGLLRDVLEDIRNELDDE